MADNSMSPAEAALNAFLNGYICKQTCNVAFEADRNGIAAALRAVAYQVAQPPFNTQSESDVRALLILHQIKAIAAELES